MQTETKGEQTQASKSRKRSSREEGRGWFRRPLAQRRFLMRQSRLICVTLLILAGMMGAVLNANCRYVFARERGRRQREEKGSGAGVVMGRNVRDGTDKNSMHAGIGMWLSVAAGYPSVITSAHTHILHVNMLPWKQLCP